MESGGEVLPWCVQGDLLAHHCGFESLEPSVIIDTVFLQQLVLGVERLGCQIHPDRPSTRGWGRLCSNSIPYIAI